MKGHAKHLRAFTLVEVLVSLAIFALASVALSGAYLNVLGGYHASDQQRERHEDWSLARMQVLIEPQRDVIESGGQFNLPDKTVLHWSAQIEPTELADLFAVELTGEVTGSDGWTQTERLMLYRPDWSDPSDREQLREESRQRLTQTRAP